MKTFYHLALCTTWRAASRNKQYPGSPNDQRDRFIQLSPRTKVEARAAHHRVERCNILLISIDARCRGPNSRLEISSSGEFLPHFYDKLLLDTALAVIPLPLDKEGQHEFPPDIPAPIGS